MLSFCDRVRCLSCRLLELPEVALDRMQRKSKTNSGRDGEHGTACRAVSLALERMTDGDVALSCEAEDK